MAPWVTKQNGAPNTMEILLKTLGGMTIGYAGMGLLTGVLYAVLVGGLDMISFVSIAISWPLWLWVLITGGK